MWVNDHRTSLSGELKLVPNSIPVVLRQPLNGASVTVFNQGYIIFLWNHDNAIAVVNVFQLKPNRYILYSVLQSMKPLLMK